MDVPTTWKQLTDKVLGSFETFRYIKFVVIQFKVSEDQNHQYHICGNIKSYLFVTFGKAILLSNQFL